MQEPVSDINEGRLLNTFLDLLKVDSPSGGERPVIQQLARRLIALDLDVEIDAAGNLLARLAGDGEPLLLCAHTDHVAPCLGIRPQVQDGVIRSDGSTILGGDDTSGVAIMLELLARIQQSGMQRPPALDILFTVGEEAGLLGAKALDTARLRARQAIVLDMGGPIGPITIQGPSQTRLLATVVGKKAHAGCEPELGINAIRVAAEAIVAMPLGRIDFETTSNIGVIQGGEATNIVPDRVDLRGEARSLDEGKLKRQTQTMLEALQVAAAAHGARVDVNTELSYRAFQVPTEAVIVNRLSAAARSFGLDVALLPTTGGSDSNILNEKGIQAVNFSTGMAKVHTTEEYIALSDMVLCTRVLAHLLGI
jgi:tripeptide aminopeptidase